MMCSNSMKEHNKVFCTNTISNDGENNLWKWKSVKTYTDNMISVRSVWMGKKG